VNWSGMVKDKVRWVFWTHYWTLGFHERWIPEVTASQKGLCSVLVVEVTM